MNMTDELIPDERDLSRFAAAYGLWRLSASWPDEPSQAGRMRPRSSSSTRTQRQGGRCCRWVLCSWFAPSCRCGRQYFIGSRLVTLITLDDFAVCAIHHGDD